MGHFLFIVLHVLAVLFGLVGLFITIPLHVIFAAMSTNKATRRSAQAELAPPSPATHSRCPDCAEFVRREARKCRHCGAALTPQ